MQSNRNRFEGCDLIWSVYGGIVLRQYPLTPSHHFLSSVRPCCILLGLMLILINARRTAALGATATKLSFEIVKQRRQ